MGLNAPRNHGHLKTVWVECKQTVGADGKDKRTHTNLYLLKS